MSNLKTQPRLNPDSIGVNRGQMLKPQLKTKKFIILALLLMVFFFTLGFYFINKPNNLYKDFSVINYKLLTTNYKLLVADTPAKWEKGLMFFRKLDGVNGMIFLFPDKQNRTFWNMNTYLDLIVYWLDGDNVIGTSDLPSIEKNKRIVTVSSPGPADKVIELTK